MTTTNTTANNGTSIAGLLGVAFIILKLCHIINWSWWLVTLPLWGGLAIVLAIMAGIGLAFLVALVLDARRDAQRRKGRR